MDVHCSTCGEPWDTFHLWHEAIFETGLSVEEAEAWLFLPHAEKLSDRYRKEFQAVGWEFGQSVINVTRCPCCHEGDTPNPEIVETKAVLEQLLGNDQDGLAATFEDHHL
jgi:hypothetical protein